MLHASRTGRNLRCDEWQIGVREWRIATFLRPESEAVFH